MKDHPCSVANLTLVKTRRQCLAGSLSGADDS